MLISAARRAFQAPYHQRQTVSRDSNSASPAPKRYRFLDARFGGGKGLKQADAAGFAAKDDEVFA